MPSSNTSGGGRLAARMGRFEVGTGEGVREGAAEVSMSILEMTVAGGKRSSSSNSSTIILPFFFETLFLRLASISSFCFFLTGCSTSSSPSSSSISDVARFREGSSMAGETTAVVNLSSSSSSDSISATSVLLLFFVFTLSAISSFRCFFFGRVSSSSSFSLSLFAFALAASFSLFFLGFFEGQGLHNIINATHLLPPLLLPLRIQILDLLLQDPLHDIPLKHELELVEYKGLSAIQECLVVEMLNCFLEWKWLGRFRTWRSGGD
ncbi:hypothetical protein FA13DRAFT_880470 [Coprinellus micaceus]|uniref:Uncharacterized protein n=1 Tax=Coprinellus micaceus TaxID=71717 RepID=A0A4Y7RZT3_COPMI|nr:hypothetical protein FA13DRAFT_880470 [Coprinellus micaceus]